MLLKKQGSVYFVSSIGWPYIGRGLLGFNRSPRGSDLGFSQNRCFGAFMLLLGRSEAGSELRIPVAIIFKGSNYLLEHFSKSKF